MSPPPSAAGTYQLCFFMKMIILLLSLSHYNIKIFSEESVFFSYDTLDNIPVYLILS